MEHGYNSCFQDFDNSNIGVMLRVASSFTLRIGHIFLFLCIFYWALLDCILYILSTIKILWRMLICVVLAVSQTTNSVSSLGGGSIVGSVSKPLLCRFVPVSVVSRNSGEGSTLLEFRSQSLRCASLGLLCIRCSLSLKLGLVCVRIQNQWILFSSCFLPGNFPYCPAPWVPFP